MKVFDGFMHGVNFGGWFSQCDHSTATYDTFITKKDFEVVKSWGLDHVRLPVDYNLVETSDGNFKEDGFSRIQNAIDWCREYGLNMILDLHKTAGFSFDAGEQETGFFERDEYQQRFFRLWEEFSVRFGKNSDMLCFELLNEVTEQRFCKKWNELARDCIRRIRKASPDIKILVGSYWNNSLAAVKDLDAPSDPNIVYNFHCYEPLLFTHQGAPWVGPNMNPDFRFALKSPFADYVQKTGEKVGQVGTAFSAFDPAATVDKAYFESIFAEAVRVAADRNVLLYCGEYGVIDKAAPQDALEWFALISSVFDRHNIGRAAWSYRQMNFSIEKLNTSTGGKLLEYL